MLAINSMMNVTLTLYPNSGGDVSKTYLTAIATQRSGVTAIDREIRPKSSGTSNLDKTTFLIMVKNLIVKL